MYCIFLIQTISNSATGNSIRHGHISVTYVMSRNFIFRTRSAQFMQNRSSVAAYNLRTTVTVTLIKFYSRRQVIKKAILCARNRFYQNPQTDTRKTSCPPSKVGPRQEHGSNYRQIPSTHQDSGWARCSHTHTHTGSASLSPSSIIW